MMVRDQGRSVNIKGQTLAARSPWMCTVLSSKPVVLISESDSIFDLNAFVDGDGKFPFYLSTHANKNINVRNESADSQATFSVSEAVQIKG